MSSQTISLAVRGSALEVSGSTVAIKSECTWQAQCDAPDVSVDMPGDGVLVVDSDTFDIFFIKGDLELMPDAPSGLPQQLRWKPCARESSTGTCSLIISDRNDQREYVEIDVEMAENPALMIQEQEEPLTNFDLINRYGAIGCIAVAVIGALMFALLIPGHKVELLLSALAIGIGGLAATNAYDRFLARALGFAVAAFFLVIAVVVPAWASDLIGIAGGLAVVAVIAGHRR